MKEKVWVEDYPTKVWTIQFDIEEVNEEFWDNNPTPESVAALVKKTLSNGYLDQVTNVKVIRFVDTHEYYAQEQEKQEKVTPVKEKDGPVEDDA